MFFRIFIIWRKNSTITENVKKPIFSNLKINLYLSFISILYFLMYNVEFNRFIIFYVN